MARKKKVLDEPNAIDEIKDEVAKILEAPPVTVHNRIVGVKYVWHTNLSLQTENRKMTIVPGQVLTVGIDITEADSANMLAMVRSNKGCCGAIPASVNMFEAIYGLQG